MESLRVTAPKNAAIDNSNRCHAESTFDCNAFILLWIRQASNKLEYVFDLNDCGVQFVICFSRIFACMHIDSTQWFYLPCFAFLLVEKNSRDMQICLGTKVRIRWIFSRISSMDTFLLPKQKLCLWTRCSDNSSVEFVMLEENIRLNF